MVKFGCCTEVQYLRAGERRRHAGAHAAYGLLDVGENPSEEEIRTFHGAHLESYFQAKDLARGASCVFHSYRPGRIWIVSRIWENSFSNHASLLRRSERGWELLERIGTGWEMEGAALDGVGT
jgi:hypothetical protein